MENSKDHLSYGKKYYDTNKSELKQMRQEKVTCSKCNKTVSRQAIWAHKRSKKCLTAQGLYQGEIKDIPKITRRKTRDLVDGQEIF